MKNRDGTLENADRVGRASLILCFHARSKAGKVFAVKAQIVDSIVNFYVAPAEW
jgi:hypothetical protein